MSDAIDAVGGVAPGWLLLGVALHLLNQVARGCGWHVVVRDAGATLRRRDVVAAWVAGAGAGGIVSARGGDAVRLLVLARRAPGTGCALLTGTLVAETAGETAVGAALLALGLAVGVGPHIGTPGTTALYALAACALAALAASRRVRRSTGAAARALAAPRAVAPAPALASAGPAADGWEPASAEGRKASRVRAVAARWLAATHGFLKRAACGCAPLRQPGRYARTVLPWQLLSRVLRLAALACFLAAFHLPATLAAVLLVVFAQTGSRVLPFSPASVGAGAAILAATFEPVTGRAVPAGQLAAYFVGTSTVLTVIGSALALAICLQAASRASCPRAAGRLRFARVRAALASRP